MGLDEKMFDIYLDIFRKNVQAMREYQSIRYGGKILFFRGLERDGVNPDHPEEGWYELAELELHEVDGNHLSMNFDPCVRDIARIIDEKLR